MPRLTTSNCKSPQASRCTLLSEVVFAKPRGSAHSERNIFAPFNERDQPEEIKQLLARISVIKNGCDLDLLLFLYRHPRALLTNEQIAAFVGYEMKQIAQSLETFIEAGLLERTQNPSHAARMYLLDLNGPKSGDFKELLDSASTRQGRRSILQVLKPDRPAQEGRAQNLRLVKRASARG